MTVTDTAPAGAVPRSSFPVRFAGPVECRRDATGPLGLTLSGTTADTPGEPLQIAFAAPYPPGLGPHQESLRVEALGARAYRIASGSQEWRIEGIAHLHRDVTDAFYAVLPARPVPWGKRLLWRGILAFAGPLSRMRG